MKRIEGKVNDLLGWHVSRHSSFEGVGAAYCAQQAELKRAQAELARMVARFEGDARDLLRAIQDLRKEAAFEFSDRIVLAIVGADDILAAHWEYISTETLTTRLLPEAQDARASKTVEIGKRTVQISVSKDD